jgi:endonuclease-3
MRRKAFSTREARAAHVDRTLEGMYPKTPIPLDHKDAFTLLVAVVLSAQCTDKRVNLVTPELFALADTPEKMAGIPVAEIQRIIRPCGLSPQKAKAISGLSRLIVERHGGRVPGPSRSWRRCRGWATRRRASSWPRPLASPPSRSTRHIHRLAKRWGLSKARNVVETERDLKALFPEAKWNKLHLRIIYYGREHCTAGDATGTPA